MAGPPWRSGGAGRGRGEEDETNFLPLPEIRIPGIVSSAPFQDQGQTQCRPSSRADRRGGEEGRERPGDWK